MKTNPSKYTDADGVIIYSIRFWVPNLEDYSPDEDGRVDMSNWNGEGNPSGPYGTYPFDFGLYDPQTNTWWHANHAGDEKTGKGMKVFQSSLKTYSQPAPEVFNMQVFAVSFSNSKGTWPGMFVKESPDALMPEEDNSNQIDETLKEIKQIMDRRKI